MIKPRSPLSKREQEVFDVLIEGATSKETADKLSLGIRTVEKHRANIMLKFGVRQFTQIVGLPSDASATKVPRRALTMLELTNTIRSMQKRLDILEAEMRKLQPPP